MVLVLTLFPVYMLTVLPISDDTVCEGPSQLGKALEVAINVFNTSN